jgi:hypothetical protein
VLALAGAEITPTQGDLPVVYERLTQRSTAEKSGVYRLGLGIEFPAVGLVVGGGNTTDFGTGYHFGAALVWEFQERYAVRVYGAGTEAFGARVWLQYQDAGELTRSEQDAGWMGIEGGIGGMYLWRGRFPSFVPFFGLEGGPLLHGYYYRLDETLEKIKGVDPEPVLGGHDHTSVHLDYKLNARVGVRMEMLSWLVSSVELKMSYSLVGEAPLTGTLAAREVKTEAGGVWTLALLYSVYLGL